MSQRLSCRLFCLVDCGEFFNFDIFGDIFVCRSNSTPHGVDTARI